MNIDTFCTANASVAQVAADGSDIHPLLEVVPT